MLMIKEISIMRSKLQVDAGRSTIPTARFYPSGGDGDLFFALATAKTVWYVKCQVLTRGPIWDLFFLLQ